MRPMISEFSYGFALTREAGGSLLLVMRPRLAW